MKAEGPYPYCHYPIKYISSIHFRAKDTQFYQCTQDVKYIYIYILYVTAFMSIRIHLYCRKEKTYLFTNK